MNELLRIFLKVDLSFVHLIEAIITQGRQDSDEWVTVFQIGKTYIVCMAGVAFE